MENPLEEALEEVRARLRLHAGGVELVAADEATGTVVVRFHGTCRSCPLAAFTLQHGVQAVLERRVPWVTTVRLADQ